jgi:hypothetical protein
MLLMDLSNLGRSLTYTQTRTHPTSENDDKLGGTSCDMHRREIG